MILDRLMQLALRQRLKPVPPVSLEVEEAKVDQAGGGRNED